MQRSLKKILTNEIDLGWTHWILGQSADRRSSFPLLHWIGPLGQVSFEELPVDAGRWSGGPLLDQLLVTRSLREFGAGGTQAAVLTDAANHFVAAQLASHLVSEFALQYHLAMADLGLGTSALRFGWNFLEG